MIDDYGDPKPGALPPSSEERRGQNGAAKVIPIKKDAKRPPPEHDEDTRPVIFVDAEALHEAADAGVAHLVNEPDVYERDGSIVHVIRVEDDTPSLPKGSPAIRPMAPATLRLRLSRAAKWIRRGKTTDTPIVPTDAIVQGILCQGEWPLMRRLIGVIEHPAPRPDGSMIDAPGYDSATGFLFAPSQKFLPVPDAPTQGDAFAALRELVEVFADFPYAKEAHRYVPIAAAMSLLGRPAIGGACPAFLFDASTRGSGKTLQSDAVGLIATGRSTAKMNYPTLDEELEKVLGAYALRGAAIVNFDNVTRPFGGGPIDRCLTAEDTVELRVLGKSEMATQRWRAVVIATGNNLVLAGDTARRVVVCRLESPLENPEDRADFTHPDLLAWVRAERPRLVRAALTILRAYFVAGRPDQGVKTWGSFGPWASLIPPAIVYAGGADVMQARPTVDNDMEDPERAALSVIVRDLPRLDELGDGLTARTIVGLIFTPERIKGCNRDGSPLAPDGFDDLREAIETLVPTKPGQQPDPYRLGRALSHAKGRVIGGRRVGAKSGGGGVSRWVIL